MPSRQQDEFDGYRKWLGIADKKRPPTHYELLAISLNEDDADVIHAAAEQRRLYVQSKRGEGHEDIVTEILYRIGEAETTLLNPQMRRDYDRKLHLFAKRRKTRQVDPNASRSSVHDQSKQVVNSDTDTVKTFLTIVVLLCVAFAGMAWFSFQLPWDKRAIPHQAAAAELPPPIAPPHGRPAPAVIPAQPLEVKSDLSTGARIVISLAKSGEGTITLSKRTADSLISNAGIPDKVAAAQHATTIRKHNGLHSLEWDFHQASKLNDFTDTNGDTEIDAEKGVMRLSPKDRGDGHLQAGLRIPLWMELPVTISFDVNELTPAAVLEIGVLRRSRDGTNSNTDFHVKALDGPEPQFNISAKWDTRGQEFIQLLGETTVSPLNPRTLRFALNNSEVSDGNRLTMRIGVAGKTAVSLSRLALSGVLVSTPITTSPVTPTPPIAISQDRLVAEWVLKIGGNLQVVLANGQPAHVQRQGDLPNQPFHISLIDLRDNHNFQNRHIAELSTLKGLRKLVLMGTLVTDDALEHLAGLTTLEELNIAGTRINGSGFGYLNRLDNLTVLLCGGCVHITDNSLVHLRSLDRLTTLGLIDTNITDAGLLHVGQFNALRELRLSGSGFQLKITDKGLRHLVNLKKLTQLTLRKTRVTARGIAFLKRSLPKCQVASDFDK